MLDIHQRFNVSWDSIGNTYYNLFRVAICSSRTLPRAKPYIQSALALYRKICPSSERLTKMFEKLLERPNLHPHFKMKD